MANTNAPFGFSQYKGNGSAPTYGQVAVQVAYNASAIYFGDPVVPQADGTYAQATSNTAAQGVGGIFVGCEYLSVSQKRVIWSNYWPGSDVASGNVVTAYIVNDPNAQFLVQADATGLDQTAVNSNVGFAIGTGTAINGISGAYIDSTTLGATNTLPFRVVGIYNDVPGAPGSYANGKAYDRVIVAFNNVATKQLTGV